MKGFLKESANFTYEYLEEEKENKKKPVYVESKEIKFEHIFQQTANDIYKEIEDGKGLRLEYIEKTLIKNMLIKFNRTRTAKILGISVRTLRNKINKYGYKNIWHNSAFL